jgi:hypothetical protein
MAKKTKKRATKTKARPTRKARPARSAAKARAKSKPAARAKARPAARAAPKARPVRATAKLAKAELDRLRREESALERDVENEEQRSTMSESPEYIAEAMEDSLGEELGEASVASATSGDQADENIRDEDVSEEVGGPFVPTTAREEFARGTDASNPEDAEPAVFPTTHSTRR